MLEEATQGLLEVESPMRGVWDCRVLNGEVESSKVEASEE